MKMKYTILFLGFGLFMISCQTKNVERKFPSGMKESYQVDVESGKRKGYYRMYYEDGALFEESYYTNDSLQGSRKMYYPGGGLEIEETYKQGVLEGPYRMYYSSGTTKLEGQYIDDKMQGVWTAYYPSGSVKEEVRYEDNYEQGPFTEYYEDGQLKAKGQYLKGDNEDGILYLYDSTGTAERVMECDSGICRTIWTPDSSFAMPNN